MTDEQHNRGKFSRRTVLGGVAAGMGAAAASAFAVSCGSKDGGTGTAG